MNDFNLTFVEPGCWSQIGGWEIFQSEVVWPGQWFAYFDVSNPTPLPLNWYVI